MARNGPSVSRSLAPALLQRGYMTGVGVDVPIKDIIASKKSGDVVTVKPTDSCAEAAKKMSDANVGSAIVIDGDKVYGIVTERDFLTKLVVKSGDASKLQVKDIATQDVVAVEESATVGNCMAVMNKKGLRHLPVVRGAKVVEVISIRDLIMAVHDNQESELTYLRDFVGSQGHMYSSS